MEKTTVLYVASSLFTAGALAHLCARRKLLGNRTANYLFGASLCPFVQFLWCLAVAATIGNITSVPREVYTWGLPVLMFILLYIEHKRNEKDAVAGLRLQSPGLLSGLLIVLFILGVIMWARTVSVVSSGSSYIQYDNMEYFGKAAFFAEHRDFKSVPFIYGLQNGSAPSDGHFPSWILYLGYAFMHTSAPVIEYPNHECALYAVALLPFYAIAASMALLCVMNKKNERFSLLMPVLLGAIFMFVNQVRSSHRDYFKIVGCLVYITVCVDFVKKRRHTRSGLVISLLSAFILVSAHLINVLVLVGSVVALCLLTAVEAVKDKAHLDLKHRIAFLASVIIGGGLGFSGNLACKLMSGSWNPLRVDFTKYAFFDAFHKLSTKPEISYPEAMKRMLYLEDSFLGFIILAVMLLFFILLTIQLFRKAPFGNNSLVISKADCFMGLLTLALFLPMTGLLDTSMFYRFSSGFAQVPRYCLSFHILGVVFIYSCLLKLLHYAQKRRGFCMALAVFGIVVFSAYSIWLCDKNDSALERAKGNENFYRPGNQLFEQRYGSVRDVLSNVGDEDRILTYDHLRYALGDRTLVYNDILAKPIYDCAPEDMADAFEELGIKAVVLRKNREDTPVSVLPWYEYVVDNYKLVTTEQYDVFLSEGVPYDTPGANEETSAFGDRSRVTLPFTAPKDGYLQIRCVPTTTKDTYSIFMINNNVNNGFIVHTYGGGYNTGSFVIREGETLDLYSNSSDSSLVDIIITYVPIK